MGYIGYVTAARLATYPFASEGDYIFNDADHENGEGGLFVISSGSHNEKNFSIGANCVGTYTTNHATDGRLKYTLGGTGNYAGPIGNRVWFYFPDHTASVSNSSGNALFTRSSHGLTTGKYIMVKNYTHYSQVGTEYSGYYYVEVVSSNTFRLKTSASGSYLAYSSAISVTYSQTIGSIKMEGIDCIGTAANPVIITNAPGSQFICQKNWESVATYGFEFFGGSKFAIITGEYDPVRGTGSVNYQGHRGNYKYSYGRYGMWIRFYNLLSNNPILYLKNGSTNLEICHLEIDGGGRGFAGIMIKSDNQPSQNMSAIHDCEGEGWYIGNTGDNVAGSAPSQHWIELDAYNNRVVRTGVEIVQTGQLKDGSKVQRNVALLGTLTHFNPFFSGQSNAAQVKPRSGNVLYDGNMLIGGTANIMLVQSNRSNEALDATKSLTFSNSAFLYGRQRFMFFTLTNDGTMPFNMENIYIKSATMYDNDRMESQATDKNEIILTTESVTEVYINGMHVDTGMSGKILQSGGTATKYNTPYITRDQSLPDPEFMKSGYEAMRYLDIHEYFTTYAADHPTHPNQNIIYTTTDIILYHAMWYRVKTSFSGGNPPPTNTNCEQIFWDINGYSSLDPTYNGVPYSNRPPDDLRLQSNDFYANQNIGLYDNEPNRSRTMIQHEWAWDNGGSPDLDLIRPLPIEPGFSLSKASIIARIGSGNHVRTKITYVDLTGKISSTVTSDWEQVS